MNDAGCGERIDIEAFEAGCVDPATFDHAAHVYLAWRYLCECGLAEAISRFTGALRTLTMHLGIEGKYHETVSWFFVIVIAERRAASPGNDWRAFRRENADLFCDGAGLLRRYYSVERLHSSLARRQFLLPDRAPPTMPRGAGLWL